MKTNVKKHSLYPFVILITLVVAFVFVNMEVGASDFKRGLSAYNEGNYHLALKNLKPLAMQGNAEAQYHLATMHVKAQGMPQDHVKSMKWYRKAAEQGHVKAQYFLAGGYYVGIGVPQDYILAHMWYNVSAAQGHPDAMGIRDHVSNNMTILQIVEAQERARRCFSTNFQSC